MKADHPESLFVVRRMRPEDIDHVIPLAAGLKDAPHWPRPVYVSALDPAATPRRLALVAEDEASNAVAGFAVASVLAPQADLESIAVRPNAQRQGVGAKLLELLVDELKAAAVNEILLEVRASNHVGLAFYGALGWKRTGIRPRYYADPEEDAIQMSLSIG
jgi:ribosomal-protein-alanine N-acetyltransferase